MRWESITGIPVMHWSPDGRGVMMRRDIMWTAVISAVLGVGLIGFGTLQSSDQETKWTALHEQAQASLVEDQAVAPHTKDSASQESTVTPTNPVDRSQNETTSATASSKKSTVGVASEDIATIPASTSDKRSTTTSTNASESTGSNSPTDEPVSTPVVESSASVQDGRISINRASLSELTELPGIGEKKAQAIIDYRNTHGAFRSVNELDNVKGIGSKMLAKMLPYVQL